MRYRVKGAEIRTENAAKPFAQRSKVVVAYLKSRPKVASVLDFGCGKLRYADLVARLGERATFVDSEIQLTRRQRIRGRTGTVAQLAPVLYSNAAVVSTEAISNRTGRRHDFVTCINVLSAIPNARALKGVLRVIHGLTKNHGTAVFVNQHRNTYFKNFERGKPHLFGFLFQGKNGAISYYGKMTKDRVQALLIKNGFHIQRAWNHGEINFVEARPL
jgi:2-polyprenyl-3-methyl-5-hydroxy-6-metoxy-1,4-benzoquinol methylase